MTASYCQSPEPRVQRWRRIARPIFWCVALGSLIACGGGEVNDPTQPGNSGLSSSTPSPATTGSAVLQWSASSDTRVTGYRVYYGASSGTYQQAKGSGMAAGISTTYNVAGLPIGRTYYFAVTSVDAVGNESDYSAEASKLIQ